MNLRERVEHRPEVLDGQPVIRGTRVSVRLLIGGLAGGMTIEQLCENFRITREDVRAAMNYALDLLRS
jgi:uncharacterized protein (DUF433 family)